MYLLTLTINSYNQRYKSTAGYTTGASPQYRFIPAYRVASSIELHVHVRDISCLVVTNMACESLVSVNWLEEQLAKDDPGQLVILDVSWSSSKDMREHFNT